MAVLVESEKEINEMLGGLRESCSKYGLKINVKKTKGMVIGGKGNKAVMKVVDEIIEQKEQFRYLGSIY